MHGKCNAGVIPDILDIFSCSFLDLQTSAGIIIGLLLSVPLLTIYDVLHPLFFPI